MDSSRTLCASSSADCTYSIPGVLDGLRILALDRILKNGKFFQIQLDFWIRTVYGIAHGSHVAIIFIHIERKIDHVARHHNPSQQH